MEKWFDGKKLYQVGTNEGNNTEHRDTVNEGSKFGGMGKPMAESSDAPKKCTSVMQNA